MTPEQPSAVEVRRTDGSATDTVRLLGTDAPSLDECDGVQARSVLLGLAFSAPADSDGDGQFDTRGGSGVLVELKSDRSDDLRTSSGRLLAYADAIDDLPAFANGTAYDLGKLQILYGNSASASDLVFARANAYQSAETAASGADRGAWGSCQGDFHAAP